MSTLIEDRKIQELPETSSIQLSDQMIIETVDGTKLVDLNSLKKILNANFIVENVESMKSASFKEGEVCITLGYRTANDGGGGMYKIVYEPTYVEDGANVHYLLTSDTNRAKFIALNDSVTPEQFGAYGDGVHDDYDAINKCLASGYKVVFKPGATYLLRTSLNVDKGASIDLNGCTLLPVNVPAFSTTAVAGGTSTKVRIANGYINASSSNYYALSFLKVESSVELYNLKIFGISNTGIQISNCLNATIQNCLLESAGPTKSAVGISTYNSGTDYRSSIINIKDCKFVDLYRSVKAEGSGISSSKVEVINIENCNGVIKLASSSLDDAFITVYNCKCHVSNCVSDGYDNHVYVPSGSKSDLTITNPVAYNAHYLVTSLGNTSVSSIAADGNVVMTKKHTSIDNNSNFFVYNSLNGRLYHNANLTGAKINGFTEGPATASVFANLKLIDSTPTESTEIINNTNTGTTVALADNVLNHTINLASSAGNVTVISGGIVGQVLRLISSGNRTIVSDNVNIVLSESSIRLSAAKSILLKKVSTTQWKQI